MRLNHWAVFTGEIWKLLELRFVAFNLDCSKQHYPIQQKLWKRRRLFGISFPLILKCNMERTIFRKVRQFADICIKRSNAFLAEKALHSSFISSNHSDFLERLWWEKLLFKCICITIRLSTQKTCSGKLYSNLSWWLIICVGIKLLSKLPNRKTFIWWCNQCARCVFLSLLFICLVIK